MSTTTPDLCSQPLVEFMDRFEAKPRLDLDWVADAAGARRNPEIVQLLGGPLFLELTAEAETGKLGLEHYNPDAPDANTPFARFMRLWIWEEENHGAAISLIMEGSDIHPPALVETASVRREERKHHLTGFSASHSKPLQQVTGRVFGTLLAMTEDTTTALYNWQQKFLHAQGEEGLADVFGRIRAQEAWHKGFGKLWTRQFDTSPLWVRQLAGMIVVENWNPVFALSDERKALFGQALLYIQELAEVHDPKSPRVIKDIEDTMQDTATDLLGLENLGSPTMLGRIANRKILDSGGNVVQFVRAGVQQCRDLAQADVLAVA